MIDTHEAGALGRVEAPQLECKVKLFKVKQRLMFVLFQTAVRKCEVTFSQVFHRQPSADWDMLKLWLDVLQMDACHTLHHIVFMEIILSDMTTARNETPECISLKKNAAPRAQRHSSFPGLEIISTMPFCVLQLKEMTAAKHL